MYVPRRLVLRISPQPRPHRPRECIRLLPCESLLDLDKPMLEPELLLLFRQRREVPAVNIRHRKKLLCIDQSGSSVAKVQ
jgi:hypothetical protein